MSDKEKVQQKRLRGRNMHDVVSQLVDEYHSANGWAVVRVSPNLLNLEVLLERSEKQAGETVNSEVEVVANEKKLEVLVEEEAPKPKATTAKKATTTKKIEV